MVCFYSIYLLIMYFNPRIEAWLYRVTNTTSPEYKSELHASNGNGKNNGYQQLTNEEGETKADEHQVDTAEDKDVDKGTTEEEKAADQGQEEKTEKPDDQRGFEGIRSLSLLNIYDR